MDYLTIIGALFVAWLIIVILFTPHIPYHIEAHIDGTSEQFIHVLESMCNTNIEKHNRIEIFTDGSPDPMAVQEMPAAGSAVTE